MMVAWFKCFESKHFAGEKTGRLDCNAFLPKRGIPMAVCAAAKSRICFGAVKFEQVDDETIKLRAKIGFSN